jgi:hypothetical protein
MTQVSFTGFLAPDLSNADAMTYHPKSPRVQA